MPADWAFAIVNVLVFGFAVYIGFLLGDGWGKRIVTAKAYWLCNLGMLVGVVLLVTLVAVPLIQVCAMGVLAGAIAGSRWVLASPSVPGSGLITLWMSTAVIARLPRRVTARRIVAVARLARRAPTSSRSTRRGFHP